MSGSITALDSTTDGTGALSPVYYAGLGPNQRAYSFTTGGANTWEIAGIRLALKATATGSYPITISLYTAGLDYKPTGTALSSVTLSLSLTTTAGYEYLSATDLGALANYSMSAGTQYALAVSTTTTNTLRWSFLSVGASNAAAPTSTGGGFTMNSALYYGGTSWYTTTNSYPFEMQVDATCFTPGTRIRTPRGDVAIEDLAIGDLVTTRDNGDRPIRWIGRRAYGARFVAAHPAIQPIRIAAGALGRGLPRRDLLLSPNHALHFVTEAAGPVLINAGLLANGATLAARPNHGPNHGDVHYLHIELDSHDIVFAEGVEAETFIDVDCRDRFANAADYAALYPDAPPPARAYCAPRVTDGFAFEEIRARLAIIAGEDPILSPGPLEGHLDIIKPDHIEGWVRDLANPAIPVIVVARLGRRVAARAVANTHRADLEFAGLGHGRHGFRLDLPAWAPTERITLHREEDGETLPRAGTQRPRLAVAA